MGVFGLWRLLDATGKPVPLETLEGKVLAIDVSIWIYQVLQGYQDRRGNPRPNAHLLGLFHRICKLLYYKIKPVFVFDGGVPMLKKNTIASRRKQKSVATSKAQKMKADLINNLIKHSAVKTVLNPDTKDSKNAPSQIIVPSMKNKPSENDMFILPDMPSISTMDYDDSEEYDSDSSVHVSPRKQSKWTGNIHSVDVTSNEFKILPADVRYDILTDLKETRKQNSWGRLHEMPEESHAFSGYQMKRLLKRRLVQECLESAEKEMGGKTLTLEELEKLLTEQGVTTKGRDAAYRIAGDSTTRLIYISDKNALPRNEENASNTDNKDVENTAVKEIEPIAGPSKLVPIIEDINEYALNDDWDSDAEFATTTDPIPLADDISQYEVESDAESDAESEMNQSRPLAKKYFGKNVMNPALTYMLEYSGLTQKQILTLLEQNKPEIGKSKESKSSQNKDLIGKTDIEGDKRVETGKQADAAIDTAIDISDETSDSICIGNKNLKTSFEDKLISLDEKFDNGKNNTVPCDTVTIETTSTVSHVEKIEEQLTTEKQASKMPERVMETVSVSDSDSDDFIEIPDVPVVEASSVNKKAPENGLQITIRPDLKVEDDLFANVFDKSDDGLTSLLASQIKSQPESETSVMSENTSLSVNDSQEIINIPAESESLSSVEETVAKPATDHSSDEKLSVGVTAHTVKTNSVEESAESIEIEDDVNLKATSDGDAKNMGSVSMEDAAKIELWIEEAKRVSPPPPPMTEEELLSLKSQLEGEQDELAASIGKLERQATGISDQIRVEAQELLRLFGIPYIVAPMEAEAQCAYLEHIKLTDGTITDDSDIWLFGGQCVYKNFFNNNKRVLRFRSSDIQHHFKLTRNEMIQLALLVGSDYTPGVPGIGPVTALEILAAFPTEGDNLLHGLTNFSSWIKSGRAPGPGRTGLRNKLRNVQIEKGFPSQAVVQAYLFPTVDESKEGFTWGRPNLVLLSDYTRVKFGWTKARFEEQINLVLKRLDELKTQRGIDSYFKLQETPKSIEGNLSKRVQKAVKRLNNEDAEENEDTAEKVSKKGKRKSKQTRPKTPEDNADNLTSDTSNNKPNIQKSPSSANKNVDEYIPQREKDKAAAFQRKLRAIEVLRKSKQGLCKTKKVQRCVRKVKKEAELSESDSSSS